MPTSSARTLFFSEYVSQTGTKNRYFEIYNPTNYEVDLTNYALPSARRWGGSYQTLPLGQYEFWNTFPSGAKIAAGGTYVIAHPKANFEGVIPPNTPYHFLGDNLMSNGNDGFKLVEGEEGVEGDNYTVIDVIGTWDNLPDQGWDVAGVNLATRNKTLKRKSNIFRGNKDWDSSRGTNAEDSEWIVYNHQDGILNTFLGEHDFDPPVPATACFTEDAIVKTDQGLFKIKDVSTNHTIDNKKIKGISKTIYTQDKLVAIEKNAFGENKPNKKILVAPFHRFLVNDRFKSAVELINNDGIYLTKYKQETLYNIILETQETMQVNNIIAETLDPNTLIAKLFDGSMTEHQRTKVIQSLKNYHKNLKNKPNKTLKDYKV